MEEPVGLDSKLAIQGLDTTVFLSTSSESSPLAVGAAQSSIRQQVLAPNGCAQFHAVTGASCAPESNAASGLSRYGRWYAELIELESSLETKAILSSSSKRQSDAGAGMAVNAPVASSLAVEWPWT